MKSIQIAIIVGMLFITACIEPAEEINVKLESQQAYLSKCDKGRHCLYCVSWQGTDENGQASHEIFASTVHSQEEAEEVLEAFGSYANELISNGACAEQDILCPDVYDPVCGALAGESETYNNICEFRLFVVLNTVENACTSGSWLPGQCRENGAAQNDTRIPHCGPGERLCQTGSDSYSCVDVDEECPDPDDEEDIPECDDDERLCQTGPNSYTCVQYGKPCP